MRRIRSLVDHIAVRPITPWLCGGRLLLALVAAAPAAQAALNSFSRLDQVGRWVIERKNTQEGAITCRAYIPSGGTWFTSNVRIGPDGFPIGDELEDASGRPYLGYKDHWSWKCGLAVQDARYVVRLCNLDKSLMEGAPASGPNLEDFLVQAVERIHGRTARMAFYAPRIATTFLRRRLLDDKQAFLSLEEVGGRKVTHFDGIPFRRVDQLEVDEARIT
jgi:hypothetical protein